MLQVWRDIRYKGFQHVTLTHDKHHIEWVNLDQCSQQYDSPQPSCDYAFDLYAAGVLKQSLAPQFSCM
jgi:hypothetical protein